MEGAETSKEEPAASLGLTLLERFVKALHIRYTVAVLLLGVIAGPPAYYLARYLYGAPVAFPSDPAGLGLTSLYYVVTVYPYFAVRFVRRRILAAEPELQALSPDGTETYVRAFRPLTKAAPPVVLTTVLFAVTIVAIGLSSGGPEAAEEILSAAVATFGYASLVWVYASGLWALYSLGAMPLRLKPYYEDAFLGARVMGSLSFALAIAYFGGMLVIGLVFFSYPLFLAMVLVLCFGGIILFFLPLVNIHHRMVEAQRMHRAAVAADFKQLLANPMEDGSAPEGITLADLKRVLTHDILERKVSAISTWPFEKGVLSQFTVVIVSVIAILVARVAQVALHL